MQDLYHQQYVGLSALRLPLAESSLEGPGIARAPSFFAACLWKLGFGGPLGI